MNNEVNIEWDIDYIKSYTSHQGKQHVVCLVGWKILITNNRDMTQLHGSVSIPIKLDLSNFTPYDLLTKKQVISWVQNILGESQVLEFEQAAIKQFNELINPSEVLLPLPWVVIEEPVIDTVIESLDINPTEIDTSNI